MKICSVFLVLISLCLGAHAETVTCGSEDGKWNVSLDINNDVARDINFVKSGENFRAFDEIPVNSYRIRFPQKLMVYEMSFSGSKYMIINRAMNGKVPADHGTAEFLLTNNPLGIAQWVDCSFQ